MGGNLSRSKLQPKSLRGAGSLLMLKVGFSVGMLQRTSKFTSGRLIKRIVCVYTSRSFVYYLGLKTY